MQHRHVATLCLLVVSLVASRAHAELLGYWSGNSNGGSGTLITNDQGNTDLDGEIFNAEFTGDGEGHTGLPGDYAINFPGEDDDYVVIPPTEETFEEITITAWVSGLQTGAWAGLVVSRADPQPIGLDFNDFSGMITYIWNDNSGDTWSFVSDLVIPEDEWAFVALTIEEDQATLYAGEKGDTLDWAVNEIEHFPQDNFGEWRWAEDDCCGGERNFSGLMDDVSIWNEALSLEEIESLFDGSATPLTLGTTLLPGDYNRDGAVDTSDIDDQALAMSSATPDLATYDENGDGTVDRADRAIWVRDHASTWMGDSNLDGEFNSADLVQVFGAGKYESEDGATWGEGDWDGDGSFRSSDLVAAFSDGGYEQGPRGAAAVPEPSGLALLLLATFGFARPRQSS